MDENALMAGAQAPAQAPDAGPAPGPEIETPELFAQYDKLRRAESMLDTASEGLVRLADLGDTVTTEDLTREAGSLVAQGLDPISMASMLAEAPTQSDLLSEWVQERLGEMAERSAQLSFVTRSVRQEIGVRTMRGLMAQHAENS